MTDNNPIHPGQVLWTGENPGIYLKTQGQAGWTSLGLFFRVTFSPYGPGCTMIILEQPDSPAGLPDVYNMCLTDNDELADYLVGEFVSKYPQFRESPGLGAMSRERIVDMTCRGDLREYRTECVLSKDLEVVMTWADLSAPIAADVAAPDSATSEHNMHSVFIDAKQAVISVNDRTLPGAVVSRNFLGREMSSAFIAISETWFSSEA